MSISSNSYGSALDVMCQEPAQIIEQVLVQGFEEEADSREQTFEATTQTDPNLFELTRIWIHRHRETIILCICLLLIATAFYGLFSNDQSEPSNEHGSLSINRKMISQRVSEEETVMEATQTIMEATPPNHKTIRTEKTTEKFDPDGIWNPL